MARLQLEKDFASTTLGWAERELELTDPEIGQTLGVDRKTVHRWRKRESAPRPEQRRQMEKLTQLKWLLENAFRTPAAGKRWLHQPVPALKGRLPISVLTDGDIDSVIEVLATHVSGAHV
ncbi:MAG TPA: antitoxin Xre/MbcA/ParS toxin-binding domain-containing protein [Gemmatimonadaceae bacterium]